MPKRPPRRASLSNPIPSRYRKLTDTLVKSGRYESEAEVFIAAMRLLEENEKDYAECVEGIRRGLEDAAAGRSQSLEEFRADFERRHRIRRPR